MTVYKCDWPGHSWPLGHYWILGCLLQSTLVGLKSSQSQKLVIVFFGDIHKNHRDNNHNSSNSSKCRSFFHNQHCWGRLLLAEIQEGMMEVSIGPSGRCLSWSGVVSHWRDAKKPNREEKEKLKNNFSTFERRKRNLNSLSPISRREREIRIPLPRLERRKRNLEFSCPVSRGERETWIPFSSFERRKRNLEFLCPVSRREREIGKYIKLSRRQKIRVVKTFPFCNLCLTQCQDEVRNQLGSWVKVKVVKW